MSAQDVLHQSPDPSTDAIDFINQNLNPVLLGSETESPDSDVFFAVDVTPFPDAFKNPSNDPSLPSFEEVRSLAMTSDNGTAAIVGYARALLEWHNKARFCGSCGSPTVSVEGGSRRQCTGATCGTRLYPRIDPVVIVLVTRGKDHCLLAKNAGAPMNMYSCVAGFLETCESIEECAVREVLEETGIKLDAATIKYHSSQPWPIGRGSMPAQLMMGFTAEAISTDIKIDPTELKDAQWFSREEVARALLRGMPAKGAADSEWFIPGPFAIAHHLIKAWLGEGVHSSL